MSQNAYTFANSFLSYGEVTLEPNQHSDPVSTQGQFFLCAEVESVTGKPFEMSFKGDEWFPMNMGLKFRLKGDDFFTKLRFRNPTGEKMVVRFYVGSGEVDDSRLNIIRNRPAPVMLAATVITGGQFEIAPGNAINLTDLEELGEEDLFPPSDKYQLARVLVTNNDPASDLLLSQNTTGGAFGSVFPRQTFQSDSSDPFIIHNYTASPIVCQVAMVWWKIEV